MGTSVRVAGVVVGVWSILGSTGAQAQSAASPPPVPTTQGTLVLTPQPAQNPAASAPVTTVEVPETPPEPVVVTPVREDGDPALPVVPKVTEDVMPPVAARAAEATLIVEGLKVSGVGSHPEYGITDASINGLATNEYVRLANEEAKSHVFVTQPTRLTVAQLQSVADKVTERYKSLGFIVARAFVPAQTVGADKVVRIEVLEGVIGKIVVKGSGRYPADVISGPLQPLKGRPLVKSEVDSGLLYSRDLPGVSIAATFQPGEQTGQTDLVLIVNENDRPYRVSVGGSNYGTEFTGRYRAQLGFAWDSPLGLGDQFDARAEYAIDPSNNVYGALSYRLPLFGVRGLGLLLSGARNQLRINTGDFAALDINGPTVNYSAGFDWKLVNTVDGQFATQLTGTYEQSKLDSAAGQLSNQKFWVGAAKFNGRWTDHTLNGVNLFDFGIRAAIDDRSEQPDFITPGRDSNFVLGQANLTRIQYLTKSQRLYLRGTLQHTKDALIPLEQFSMGGPDSVRAYPIADALRDRGYYTALEYHVDAPFFGDAVSPFYSRPWRELIEFLVFADYAKGYPEGDNALSNTKVELSGVGGGVIFRIPRFHQLIFNLQAAAPLGSFDASDGNDYHVYGQFGLVF